MKLAVECSCGTRVTVSTETAAASIVCPACAQRIELPGVPADAPDANPQSFLMLLTPEHEIAGRVFPDALAHFIAAALRVIRNLEDADVPGVDIDVALALLPTSRTLLQVRSFPDLPAVHRQRLTEQLEGLACPLVRGGWPVAFCIREQIHGGSTESNPGFSFPFVELVEPWRGGGIEALILTAAGLPLPVEATVEQPAPAINDSSNSTATPRRSRRWWKRAWRQVQGWWSGIWSSSQKQRAANRDEAEQTAPQWRTPPVIDLTALPTIEEVTELIREFPVHVPYYMVRARLYQQADNFDATIADLQTAIDITPQDVSLRIIRAETYLQHGTLQPALADLNIALQHEPRSVLALALRGTLYVQLRALPAAELDFSLAIDCAPHDPRLYFDRGRVRAVMQQYTAALEDFNATLKIDPYWDEALAMRGKIRLEDQPRREDVEAAVADFTAAIEQNPDEQRFYVWRAECLIAMGRRAEAVVDCNRALRSQPDDPHIIGLRGMAREQLDPAGAVQDCTRALDGGFDPPTVYLSRGIARSMQGELHAALEDFDQAVDAAPDLARAYNSRGITRMSLEMHDDALADFGRAIELAPHWELPYLNRAGYYALQDEWEQALADYNIAIELDPFMAIALVHRGGCYAGQLNWDKALADFAAAEKLEPDLPPIFLERGKCWWAQDEWERARVDFNRALELNPEWPEALFRRANLLSALEEYDGALADYNTLVRLCPELGIAYSGRGAIWAYKGKTEEAEADYREAMELSPSSAESVLVHQGLVEADFHRRQERFDEAIARATEVIESFPDCLPAYRLRAGANWYAEQFVEALDDFSWLIEHDDELCAAFAGRGAVRAELGEYAEALHDLERALAMGQESESKTHLAYIRNGRGLALAGLGRLDEALLEFERSILDCPRNAWAQYNLALTYLQQQEKTKAGACFRLALELDAPRLTPRKRARARGFLVQLDSPGH